MWLFFKHPVDLLSHFIFIFRRCCVPLPGSAWSLRLVLRWCQEGVYGELGCNCNSWSAPGNLCWWLWQLWCWLAGWPDSEVRQSLNLQRGRKKSHAFNPCFHLGLYCFSASVSFHGFLKRTCYLVCVAFEVFFREHSVRFSCFVNDIQIYLPVKSETVHHLKSKLKHEWN